VGAEVMVRLFGPGAVVRPDGTAPSASLGGAKLRRILEVLALEAGHPVTKDRLAELVWEGKPPASYFAALESYVCVLRRKAGLGAGRASAIATTAGGYLLDADRVSVDCHEFAALAARACTEPSAASLLTARQALALKVGTLLDDEPYAEWAARARDRCRAQETSLCVRASAAALVTGCTGEAVDLARRAVDLSPLAEEATQRLMRALWLSGRRADALRAYLDLRAGTLEELGEEPSRDTHRLYLAILRQEGCVDAVDSRHDLRILLQLLRQTLEVTPCARAPALDAELAASAIAALNRTAAPVSGTGVSPSAPTAAAR
jgi:DNA-binding SARP family transcriptional activator